MGATQIDNQPIEVSIDDLEYHPSEYHDEDAERLHRDAEKKAEARARVLMNEEARRDRRITLALALQALKDLIPNFSKKNAGLTTAMGAALSLSGVPLTPDKATVVQMNQQDTLAWLSPSLIADQRVSIQPERPDLSENLQIQYKEFDGFSIPVETIRSLLTKADIPAGGIRLTIDLSEKDIFLTNFVDKLGDAAAQETLRNLVGRVEASNGDFSMRVSLLPPKDGKVVVVPELLANVTMQPKDKNNIPLVDDKNKPILIYKGSVIILGEGNELRQFHTKLYEDGTDPNKNISRVVTMRLGDEKGLIRQLAQSAINKYHLNLSDNHIVVIEFIPGPNDSDMVKMSVVPGINIVYGDHPYTNVNNALPTQVPGAQLIKTPEAPLEDNSFAKIARPEFASMLGAKPIEDKGVTDQLDFYTDQATKNAALDPNSGIYQPNEKTYGYAKVQNGSLWIYRLQASPFAITGEDRANRSWLKQPNPEDIFHVNQTNTDFSVEFNPNYESETKPWYSDTGLSAYSQAAITKWLKDEPAAAARFKDKTVSIMLIPNFETNQAGPEYMRVWFGSGSSIFALGGKEVGNHIFLSLFWTDQGDVTKNEQAASAVLAQALDLAGRGKLQITNMSSELAAVSGKNYAKFGLVLPDYGIGAKGQAAKVLFKFTR